MTMVRAAERHVVWMPEKDITAYELSQATPFLIFLGTHHYFAPLNLIEALPVPARRHFIFEEVRQL
mgnify:CR=1 FL=1